jgi:multisubunit Na+/H+ antiporter MnhB subunit
METLRAVIVGVVGLCIAALMIVVMATIGLALVGAAVVVAAVVLVAAKFGYRPRVHKRGGPRVWNDGHGTIIDM